MIEITSRNVGRIAERIVANELEARGFRVNDLNKDGIAANADLVAISPSQTLQIQVKGATNGPKDRYPWVGYGYLSKETLSGDEPVFNRRKSFYKANTVTLVALRSLTEYTCFVLPIDVAQRAAQLHLAAYRDRGWKPGPTHLTLEPGPRARESDPRITEERELLALYRDEQGWERLLQSNP
jgi:hypothetical protein